MPETKDLEKEVESKIISQARGLSPGNVINVNNMQFGGRKREGGFPACSRSYTSFRKYSVHSVVFVQV